MDEEGIGMNILRPGEADEDEDKDVEQYALTDNSIDEDDDEDITQKETSFSQPVGQRETDPRSDEEKFIDEKFNNKIMLKVLHG